MPAPTDEQLTKFIDESRKLKVPENDIDDELNRMLTVDKAPAVGVGAPTQPEFDPHDPMKGQRTLRGGQIVSTKKFAEAIEGANIGQQAAMMMGPAGAIPSIGGYLIGQGLEGIAARSQGKPGPSVGEVATDVGVMALAPPFISSAARGGLRAIKGIGTAGTAVAENLLGRLAGVSTPELRTAAQTPAITQGTAPRAADVMNKMRTALGSIRKEGIPEYAEASKLLKGARSVRVGPALKVLSKGVPQPVGDLERAAAKELRNTMDDIIKKTGSKSWDEAMTKQIPAKLAEDLKQSLQAMADYSGREVDDPINAPIKRAAASIRGAIENSLPNSTSRAQYSKLMRTASQKMEVKNKLTAKVGEYKDTAENFVRLLHRAGKTEQRELVGKFDRLFGTNFLDESRIADALEAFGGETPAFTSPRFTATGGLLGPGLGATIGGSIGGVPGALGGAVAGLAAGSPRGAIAFERGTLAVRDALQTVARKGGRSLADVERSFPSITAAISPGVRNAINAIFRDPHMGPEEKAIAIEKELGRER